MPLRRRWLFSRVKIDSDELISERSIALSTCIRALSTRRVCLVAFDLSSSASPTAEFRLCWHCSGHRAMVSVLRVSYTSQRVCRRGSHKPFEVRCCFMPLRRSERSISVMDVEAEVIELVCISSAEFYRRIGAKTQIRGSEFECRSCISALRYTSTTRRLSWL